MQALASVRSGRTPMTAQMHLHRHGVAPDSMLYGTLMSVAGRAGDMNLAFSLQTDMLAEGILPCQARVGLTHRADCAAPSQLVPTNLRQQLRCATGTAAVCNGKRKSSFAV